MEQYKKYAQNDEEKELDVVIREYKKIYNYQKQFRKVLFNEYPWIYLIFKKHKVLNEYCITRLTKGRNRLLERSTNKKICIIEINENIRRIFNDEPLTMPLSILNRNCEFKKRYEIAFNLRENIRSCGWCGVEFKDDDDDYHCSKECWTKNKEYRKKYWEENKEIIKVKVKEYAQRTEVKARIKEYAQRPEVKARKKEYAQRTEVKERKKEKAKEYYQRPEVKTRQKEYSQRPEVKARQKERRQELNM